MTEPHHAVRRARRSAEVSGKLEVLFGRLARARALQIGLAEKEDRVRREPMGGLLDEERLQLRLGVGILPRLVGVDRRVELLACGRSAKSRPLVMIVGGASAGFGATPSGVGRSISSGAPSGALGAVEPMTLGAPGAFGSSAGSKASLLCGLRPEPARKARRSAATPRRCRRLCAAQAKLDVLAKALERSSSRWFWFCSSSIWPLARRRSSSRRSIRTTSAAGSPESGVEGNRARRKVRLSDRDAHAAQPE